MPSPACASARRAKPKASTLRCTTKRAITCRRMERRDFLKLCAAGAAAAGAPALGADARPQFYSRTLLLDDKGAPLRARQVPVERNLIFHYPFAGTPCFLLNLGRPAKASALLKTED